MPQGAARRKRDVLSGLAATRRMAKWTAAALGGLVIAGVVDPRDAAAQTQQNVVISGPGGTNLLGRVYAPASPTSGMPGAVWLRGPGDGAEPGAGIV